MDMEKIGAAELLDFLVHPKNGKIKPSGEKRERFKDAYRKLIAEEGFSEQAEVFLYSGYAYAGAEPFFEYMKGSASQVEALSQLKKGANYGKNSSATSTLLVHLLALNLNDESVNLKVIIPLMAAIPARLKNKDGKIDGNAGTILRKYFLNVLYEKTELPSLAILTDKGASPALMREFANTMVDILDAMALDTFNLHCQANGARAKAWLEELRHGPQAEERPQERVNPVIKPEPESVATVEVAKPDKEASEPEQTETQAAEGNTPRETEAKLPPEKEEAIAEAAVLEEKLAGLQRAVNDEHSLRLKGETLIERQKAELAQRESQIAELGKQIEALTGTSEAMKKELVGLREELAARDEKISELRENLEMLRRDRESAAAEKLASLANKLSSFYADFCEAEEMEMSLDVGEIVRDQLRDVFKILKQAGLSL